MAILTPSIRLGPLPSQSFTTRHSKFTASFDVSPDVMYSKVKLSQVKPSQVRWSEVKWSEVKWRQVKWSELKWSEFKWIEVKWSKVKYIKVLSVHTIKAYGGVKVGSTKYFNLSTRSKCQLHGSTALAAEKNPDTYWMGNWMDPHSRPGRYREEKSLAPAGTQHRVVQIVA